MDGKSNSIRIQDFLQNTMVLIYDFSTTLGQGGGEGVLQVVKSAPIRVEVIPLERHPDSLTTFFVSRFS